MTRPTTIYGLVDPRDGELRYIGKSVDLPRRMKTHLARRGLTPTRHSCCWLIGLLDAGLEPMPVVLEVVPHGGDWQTAERKWIARYRKEGARLTNLVDGGEGVAGYVFPPDRREYLSKKFAGRLFSPEWRRKIAEAKQGTAPIRTPEIDRKRLASIRATYAAKMAARTHCREGHELAGANVRNDSRGYRFCVTCYRAQKLAAYHRRKPPLLTPEERRKRWTDSKQSPEVRARFSAAQKARIRTPEQQAAARERWEALRQRDGFEAARVAGYTFEGRSRASLALWAVRKAEITAKRNETRRRKKLAAAYPERSA